MNFLRIKFVFCLLILQSLLFAQEDNLTNNSPEIRSPQRTAANTTEPVAVSLCKSEIDSLIDFLHLTRDTLKELLSANVQDADYHLPAKDLRKEYSNIKNILIKLNNGEKFHPTPESDRIMQRQIAAISGLSHAEFQQGSPENYIFNLNNPCGSALFPTPYDNTGILTPEWLTLASILHDDNFERSLEHSPHSPSGIANWHHAFQTHAVIHLIARAVHKEHHVDLHPVTTNSQIDRQEFSCERLRLNQAWALLAATRSIANALLAYSNDDEQDNFLSECSSLYSSNASSSAISEDTENTNRALNDEYDDEDDGIIRNTNSAAKSKKVNKVAAHKLKQKIKTAKSANKNNHINNLNQKLKGKKNI